MGSVSDRSVPGRFHALGDGKEATWRHPRRSVALSPGRKQNTVPIAEDAARFVSTLDRPGQAADRFVLIESESIRPRLGYSAQRSGGVAHVIGGERIVLAVTFRRKDQKNPDLDAKALTAELQGEMRAFVELTL